MSPYSNSDLQELLAQREWLQRLARRLLGDGPDADDLTQETLTRALVSPTAAQRGRAWLATVARNLLFERQRGEAHRRAREEASARPEAVDDREALERAALRQSLLSRVLELPDPGRTAVVLRYLEGMSYEDIAARQATSVVTVRKRVSRAIDRLREELDEAEGGRQAWALTLAPMCGLDSLLQPAIPLVATPKILLTGMLAMSPQLKLTAIGLALGLFVLVAVLQLESIEPAAGVSGIAEEAAENVASHQLQERQNDTSQRETVVEETHAIETAEEQEPETELAFVLRPEEEVGTLELRIRWSDGTPAAGVSARLMPWGSHDAFLHERSVVTDRHGVGLVEQLAPGSLGVYLDRCGGGRVEIIAGALARHEVEIPLGVKVSGRVLDPEGRAVSGATICLSAHGNNGEGFPVGFSGIDGSYEVRGVNSQRFVSARAPGFAPSDQIYSKGAEGAEVNVDLVLRGEAGTIRGVVLTPNGDPLVGARVQITGSEPADWEDPEDGRWRAKRPLPFALRTDQQGRFESDEVGSGSLEVQVRAELYAPWEQQVYVLPGQPHELEITLDKGCSLRGIVTHADGTPAEGANVSFGGYGGFNAFRGRCGSDGSYRINGLPSGELDLSVTKSGRGKAKSSVRLDPGEDNRWDVTLIEGVTVRGQVVDERGQPLASWLVGVTTGDGLWATSDWTDEQGRFELTDLKDGAAGLAVGPRDAFQTGPALMLPDALPTSEDLLIEVPDANRPKADVKLRVLIDDEPAGGDTRVVISSSTPFSHREVYPDENGRIHETRFRAGEYELRINAPDRAALLRRFSVEHGESMDLGDVVVAVGGRVRLVLDGTAVGDLIPTHASVLDEQGAWIESFDLVDGRGESGLLPPGPVRIHVLGGETAMEIIEGVVDDGGTIELRASLRPGTSRLVVASTANGSAIGRGSIMRLYDQAGRLVLRFDNYGHGQHDRSIANLSLNGLEVGSYRIVFQLSDGRRGETEFAVTSLAPESEPVAELILE